MANITLGMVVVVVMVVMMMMMRRRKTLSSSYKHVSKVRLISVKTI